MAFSKTTALEAFGSQVFRQVSHSCSLAQKLLIQWPKRLWAITDEVRYRHQLVSWPFRMTYTLNKILQSDLQWCITLGKLGLLDSEMQCHALHYSLVSLALSHSSSQPVSLAHTRTLQVHLHNQVHEASLIIWPPGQLPATSSIPLLGSY